MTCWTEGGLKSQALPPSGQTQPSQPGTPTPASQIPTAPASQTPPTQIQTGQIRMMTEGTVTYKLSSPQLPPAEAEILDSVTYTLSIKGSRIRTDFTGGLGNTSTIYSSLTHAGALLREYGQQKLLVRMTREDFEELGKAYRYSGYNLTGDTTMIAGYLCKKAWSTTASGDTLVVWYAPDLLPQNKEYSYRFTPLPGLPLEYQSMMGKWKVTYKAAKISMEPVPSSRFDIPKAGYREMTYKESKALLPL